MAGHNKGHYSQREQLVMAVLEDAGWSTDPGAIPGAILDWNDRFPSLKFVQDGREITGWSRDGRGTSLYDGCRLNAATMLHDWVSVKTATIAADGKLPAKLGISTGTADHIRGIMEGIEGGASIPLLVFAEDSEGNGYTLTLDLAEKLRGIGFDDLQCPPDGGWGRGKAPKAWLALTTRKCGDGGNGIRTYLCLTVSLFAMGIKKTDWVSCSADQTGSRVEAAFDWEALAKV